MRDNELINLVGQTLTAACVAAGWSTFEVLQVQGPTQQGTPSGPSVLFQKLFDAPYGWPKEKLTYNQATPQNPVDSFTDASIQEYQTTFQISSLVIQHPDDTALPTASDVANMMKQYMNARHTISEFMALGVGILRVTQVRNEYFEDDRHRNEAHPTFDIVFTHRRQVDFSVPAVHTVDGEVYPVPANPTIPV